MHSNGGSGIISRVNLAQYVHITKPSHDLAQFNTINNKIMITDHLFSEAQGPNLDKRYRFINFKNVLFAYIRSDKDPNSAIEKA